MFTLLIDTCLEDCTLAVAEGGTVVASVSRRLGIGHAEHIGPMAAELFSKETVQPDRIERIGCVIGPGSFMGVRVGLSFAKGFALAYGLPTYPVTSFDAIACSAPSPVEAVIIDARRDQVYVQVMDGASPPQLLSQEDARAALSHLPCSSLAGTGVPVLFGEDGVAERATAPGLARATQRASTAPLSPLYLRPPDARRSFAPHSSHVS